MTRDREITHALSFDIEDWFHLVEIKAVEHPSKWPDLESIVVPRTRQILAALKEFNTHATFFILGWIAERHPGLARMIAEEGHEIGTHSFWHCKVYELDRGSFSEDLRLSIEAIEHSSGGKVYGFRAPSFSITPGAEWAFDVLLEAGLEYDASLFPARRGHGGYPCPRGPHLVRTSNGKNIPELPASVIGAGPVSLCFSGGGYFRLFPLRLIEYGIKKEAAENRPAVIYLHPRDFAPDCPVVEMPLYRRFKSYVGLESTEPKLRTLLKKYRFDTCRSVLREHLGSDFPKTANNKPATPSH
jgi:polysaccharide deacetylase family protein (PEP-CTERM system associated)